MPALLHPLGVFVLASVTVFIAGVAQMIYRARKG